MGAVLGDENESSTARFKTGSGAAARGVSLKLQMWANETVLEKTTRKATGASSTLIGGTILIGTPFIIES
jgi:hypothetical protein